MWYGKVGLIMVLLSLGIFFMGYYITTIFPNNTTFASNSHFTYNATKTLANSFKINNNINTSLIFGDFLNALIAMTGIFIGAPIADALSGLPFVGTDILLLVQIIYGSSNFALWVYIIANRSI